MSRSALAGALVALVASAPASAQAPTPTIDLLDAAIAPCLAANQNKTNPPQDDLAVCAPMLGSIDAIHGGLAAPSQHDANLRHMYRAFVQTMIGGAYAEMDKVRSARVCTQSEQSWAELAMLVDAQSPADFAEAYAAMRTAAVATITKCRAEMGTPPGAPSLPGG